MSDLDRLRTKVLQQLADTSTMADLEAVRVSALGKKGEVTSLMKNLGRLPPDERKTYGQSVNRLKTAISEALETRKAALEDLELERRLKDERVDVSQTIPPRNQGRLHPISQTVEEVAAIFGEMGFTIVEGPEIDDDWHNFTALNMPADHPARQMQDTFYMKGHSGDEGSLLLRTHTSNMQIRVMEKQPPPIRIISLGRTYRCDSDATHTPMFGQVEGLVIEKSIHMGHLKGCLLDFTRTYFEVPDLKLQFRPSFFPFTEPSAEVDIGCDRSGGELKIGVGEDWLEILGCGMVHPHVLTNCGIDPEEYQGFAFGMGLERIAMLKYGIPDLRTFFESDVRWLEHYGFNPLTTPTLLGGLQG